MERCKRFILIIYWSVILCVIFAILPIRFLTANAVAETIQNGDIFLSNVDMVFQIENDQYLGKGQIESVAVSKDGYILLIFDEGNTTHHIELYTNEFNILYHLVIKEAGSITAMFDDKSNCALLYFLREGTSIKIDPNDNYISEYKTAFDFDEINKENNSFEKTVGGKTYKYEKNILSKSFVVTQGDGIIVFQRETQAIFARWLVSVGLLTISIGCLVSIKYCLKRVKTS